MFLLVKGLFPTTAPQAGVDERVRIRRHRHCRRQRLGFYYTRLFTGPSTVNACNGLLIAKSAAPNIAGNKFNFNTGAAACNMISVNPSTNGQSIEPVRIFDNSL
jgi:hypothetical protein